MTECAILFGKRDTEMGLWTTLPGADARFDDPADLTKFSFSSSWSRMGRLLDVGRITAPATHYYARDYGFVPIVSARAASGTVPNSWALYSSGSGWWEYNSPEAICYYYRPGSTYYYYLYSNLKVSMYSDRAVFEVASGSVEALFHVFGIPVE